MNTWASRRCRCPAAPPVVAEAAGSPTSGDIVVGGSANTVTMTWLVPRGVKIRSGWRRNGVRTPTLDAVCARVLVAEDDEKQAEVLRLYLESEGHTVVLAPDGRAALDEARRRGPAPRCGLRFRGRAGGPRP